MPSFKLQTSNFDAQYIYWADICGHHEIVEYSPDFGGALRLVQTLISSAAHDQAEIQILDMSLSDFDRLISELHRTLYSNDYDCQSDCGACEEAFEYSLSEADLFQSKPRDEVESIRQGQYKTDEGWVFRPPSVRDVVESANGANLVLACTLDGQPPELEIASEIFEALAPIGTNIIESSCPHCDAPQTINFDVVRYFMTMLSRERSFLIHEVHTLAKAYGWALPQILNLPRTIRRDLVKLATRDTAIASRQRRSA